MLNNLLDFSALIQPAGARLVRIDHVARQSVQENEVHALDGLPVPAGTYVAVDVTILIPKDLNDLIDRNQALVDIALENIASRAALLASSAMGALNISPKSSS